MPIKFELFIIALSRTATLHSCIRRYFKMSTIALNRLGANESGIEKNMTKCGGSSVSLSTETPYFKTTEINTTNRADFPVTLFIIATCFDASAWPHRRTKWNSHVQRFDVRHRDDELGKQYTTHASTFWVTCADSYTRDCWQHIRRRDVDCLCIDRVYLFVFICWSRLRKIHLVCMPRVRTTHLGCALHRVSWMKKKSDSWNCLFYLHVELRLRFCTDWMKLYRTVIFKWW